MNDEAMTFPGSTGLWPALLELRWHADAHAESMGWDQPAQLLSLHAVTVPDRQGVAAAILPGWDRAIDLAGHPTQALGALCAVYETLGPRELTQLLLPGAIGVLLIHEAWMLRDPAAIAAGHRPSTSPSRVEVRLTHLVTPAAQAVLAHERDGIASELGDTGSSPARPGVLAGPLTGLLHQACHLITSKP